jgi:hypothetical protein
MYKFSIRLSAILFVFSLTLMIHDTFGVNEKLSQDDIQYLVASRPTLYDNLGKPIQANDAQYENAVRSGTYKVEPGSSIPVISPKGEIKEIDTSHIQWAYMAGWKVEPLEHQADRLLEKKQQDSMWLSDWPNFFFHVVLCQFSAILLLGAMVLVRSSDSEKNVFSYLGYK